MAAELSCGTFEVAIIVTMEDSYHTPTSVELMHKYQLCKILKVLAAKIVTQLEVIRNGSCLNVRISVTSNVSSNVFSISETEMIPVHDYEK